MGKNDTVVIDSIIQRGTNSADLSPTERAEAFQRVAFEQLLKHRTPGPEDIDIGIVDGSGDGGIDGLYISVNGFLMADVNSVPWPKAGVEIEVWILTCKHQDRFRQAPLDNLYSSLDEILDFSVPNDRLSGSYSELILQRRMDIYFAYQKGAHALRSFSIYIGYICRGDSTKIGESIVARSKQITARMTELFRHAKVQFEFHGAAEIVDLFRRVQSLRLKLRFLELLSRENSYLLVVSLREFASFVTDEKGEIRQILFDSNIRDFMGSTQVNRDIRNTLLDDASPEFWWLNNGVTMLVTEAAVIGKDILLENIQIVNGLQTTECIFRHFQHDTEPTTRGSLLVRVIQSSEDSVRDAIIRSTNNQTPVEAASLYATDRIQRDIEEMLRRHGLCYERRKNHYVNRFVSTEKIITPLYLGAGYVALGLRNPVNAQSFGNGAIRNQSAYRTVFLHGEELQIWVVIAHILKFTDDSLQRFWRQRGSIGNFVQRWRYVAAFMYTVRSFGNLDYSSADLSNLEIESMDEAVMLDTIDMLVDARAKWRRQKRWDQAEFKKMLTLMADRWDLRGLDLWRPGSWSTDEDAQPTLYDEGVAMRVNQRLPEQPWRRGVHREVARELGYSATETSRAIQLLIERGVRYEQNKGVMYDSDGFVVGVDRDIVDDDTIKSLRWRETGGDKVEVTK